MNISTAITHLHKKCGRTWKATPSNIVFNKSRCPHCAKESGGYKKRPYERDGCHFVIQGYEDRTIDYLVDNGIIATDLQIGTLTPIRYSFEDTSLLYYPDIWISSALTYVETKSTYTLGLKWERVFRMNQAKARATVDAGFQHLLVVVFEKRENGLLVLPDDWFDMPLSKVRNMVHRVSKR